MKEGRQWIDRKDIRPSLQLTYHKADLEIQDTVHMAITVKYRAFKEMNSLHGLERREEHLFLSIQSSLSIQVNVQWPADSFTHPPPSTSLVNMHSTSQCNKICKEKSGCETMKTLHISQNILRL